MGLIDLASGNSLWRGMEYYEGKKVVSVKQTGESEYEGIVNGSSQEPYHVVIDIDHPKKSKCTCPFADGRRVICKHMVATYFSVFPKEAERINKEAEEYEAEEEKRWEEERKEIEKYVNSLSKQELRNALICYMMEERERRY